jgi:SOS-response transcriptional repressor LexA
LNFAGRYFAIVERRQQFSARSLSDGLSQLPGEFCPVPDATFIGLIIRIEGYLKVSPKFLPHRKQDLYVLVADGLSMNLAEVRQGVTIEDGDYVVVDSSSTSPKNGDIVVAVIDGMATIKRYKEDKEHERIVLEAESTEKFHPIFVHEGDDFVVSGKVIDVIKKPKDK